MKKNAILFSASNYTKSPLIQIDDLPGVKYDIQAMHKRLTQIGFEVKQIENISKDQIIPALEDNASHSPCDAIHIVYFTGHGGHNNGNNYIYPVDFASKFEKICLCHSYVSNCITILYLASECNTLKT